MIRILHVTSPESVPEMARLVQVDDEPQRLEFAQKLAAAMVQTPDRVQVLQARRDDELVGFTISENASAPYVWLAQGWSKPGNSWQVADELWLRVMLWAIGLGKNEIRAESGREVSALHRRFGFEDFRTVVQHKIDPNLLSHMLGSMKEVLSGQ